MKFDIRCSEECRVLQVFSLVISVGRYHVLVSVRNFYVT
jgi:hypothetical protein